MYGGVYNESMETVLTLTKVSKQFSDVLALRKVSFSVKKGEIVGFVGANGAGKTTAISTILGFISATEGEVRLFDEAVSPSLAHKLHSRIGYAAGDMELPPKLTGAQFLQFVAHQTPGDHTERLAELTKRFSPELDKKIGTLSRGNKQKIALIAAFMTNPELVVLDEPTSGLDPLMQEAFLELVKEVRARGVTVFMSSHYLAEVADVCSRVLLMRSGKLLRDISAAELQATSAKQVRIVTSYPPTKPPTGATDVEVQKTDRELTLRFVYRGPVHTLQLWVAAVKNLKDLDVSEYSLEAMLASLYEDEEAV